MRSQLLHVAANKLLVCEASCEHRSLTCKCLAKLFCEDHLLLWILAPSGCILNISAWHNWQTSHLHSGPEHAGSQTAPQCNPPPSKTVSQLGSHTAPDAPECQHSAPPLHTSVARCQGDPETERSFQNVYLDECPSTWDTLSWWSVLNCLSTRLTKY